MAIPIRTKPAEVDPRAELMRKIESAPRDHAEALLVAWSTLQTAHDKGILDLMQGMMSGRDAIATEMGKAMKSPDMVRIVRNGIALGGLLASLDPEMLHRVSGSVSESMAEQAEKDPPSLWQLFKRVSSEDGRRGLSLVTRLLTGVGRSLKPGR